MDEKCSSGAARENPFVTDFDTDGVEGISTKTFQLFACLRTSTLLIRNIPTILQQWFDLDHFEFVDWLPSSAAKFLGLSALFFCQVARLNFQFLATKIHIESFRSDLKTAREGSSWTATLQQHKLLCFCIF